MPLSRNYRFCAVLIMAAFLSIASGSSEAGTTGKVTGTVTDAWTGEPLQNANVVILESELGAATMDDGAFYIRNVPAGTYDLKASYMGYMEVVLTDVKVAPDFTTELEFALEPTVLNFIEPVKVRAEKPLIQRDRTGTARFLDGEEIQNKPVRGYQEAVSLQAGIVARSPGPIAGTNQPLLHIRGGRSNEVAYYVDGFSQQDPLTGLSTTAINQNAIDQVVVLTGGFDAEYGKIMSGAVNVVTREGRDDYFGSVELVTDNLSGDWVGSNSYDYNVYDMNLGGPVPGTPSMNFFVSGERRWSGDRTPRPLEEREIGAVLEGTGLEAESDRSVYGDGRLPNNTLSGWTWQGKLSWDLAPTMKLKLGTLGSVDRWQEYWHSYLLNSNHNPRYEDSNKSYFGRFTHTVDPKLFYEVGLSWFYTERYRGDGVHFKDLAAYARPDGNPRYDTDASLFWYGDSANGEHVWDDYLHRESSYIGLQGDVTHEWRHSHTAKAGFEYRRHTLRRYHHLHPVGVYQGESSGYQDLDRYGYGLTDPEQHVDDGLDGAKHPVDLGLYLQDKYERDDFVLRAGLRYDYLSPEAPRVSDETLPLGEDGTELDEETDLTDSKAYHKLSPRLGLGFPVGERTLFHANYGKFFQQPNLEDLYVSYGFMERMVNDAPYYFAFGNPNLEPEETTAYEVGFTRQVSRTATVDIAAFYKDVKNLVEVTRIYAYPNQYPSYRNRDYGTIKGIDLSFDLRRTQNVAASLYYTLSWAKGTGSTSDSQRNIAWGGSENAQPPKQTAPLDFDQRHKITLNLDWRVGRDVGPQFGSFRPLENSGINLLVNLGSGLPYTPSKPYDAVTLAAVSSEPAGPINSRRGPWTFRVDVKVNRGFEVGGAQLNAYVWVLNLFNRRNPLNVYDTTGDPFSTGWLAEPTGANTYAGDSAQGLYDLRQNNPNNFDVPRLVRFGLKTSF
ncbi:MAG: TonB-dependent receptor [Candidatus Eisenbacteria bacterium]|nr:TonB-dependent receptor [Candidatus Eisenbacteria bacterium]